MVKKYVRLTRIALEVLKDNPKIFFKKLFLMFKLALLKNGAIPAEKNINGVVFKLDFNDCSDLKKMIYYDMYEMGVVGALKSFLREGDTFIDAGANIGYITAVAASLVGKNGHVYSFEPVPEYFLRLKDLAVSNKEYKIMPVQAALSNAPGQVKIYLSDYSNIGANTILPELIGEEKSRGSILAETFRLDEYIEREKIENIKLIKIDTEGFEYPVLLGMEDFFKKIISAGRRSLPFIVCEICPPAYEMLGYKLEDIFKYMDQFGYAPYSILNHKKRINIEKIKKESTINIIFRANYAD